MHHLLFIFRWISYVYNSVEENFREEWMNQKRKILNKQNQQYCIYVHSSLI